RPCLRDHPARPGVKVETPSVNPGWFGGLLLAGWAGSAPEGRTMSPDRPGAGGVKGRRRRSRRDAQRPRRRRGRRRAERGRGGGAARRRGAGGGGAGGQGGGGGADRERRGGGAEADV